MKKSNFKCENCGRKLKIVYSWLTGQEMLVCTKCSMFITKSAMTKIIDARQEN